MPCSRLQFIRLLTALPLASCRVLLPEASRPVRRLDFTASQDKADELVILLPGRHSRPEEFVREGIVKQVQERRPGARVTVPDLHLGYYQNRTATACLWEEMIRPARDEKLKVSLLGISLGGLGALITYLDYPAAVDEVMLLAPYLGEEPLFTEIRTSGPPAGLKADRQSPRNQEEAMRMLWARLLDQKKSQPQRPLPITLACGKKDRHLAANRLFADRLLAPHQYQEVEGGHDWPAWRQGTAWLLR